MAALSLLAVCAATAVRQSRPTLADADRDYEQKSYAEALKAYEAILEAKQVPADRQSDVEYRRVVSLGKTRQWDRALAEGLRFVQAHQNTVWEPRGLYWLGRLYSGLPHRGFKVGERTYRGDDVPAVAEATSAPEPVYLGEQDQRNALDALEAARVFYPAYRKAHGTEAEETQLCFDLGRLLDGDPRFYQWVAEGKWDPPSSATWRVDPRAPYDPGWPWPKKRAHASESALVLAGKDRHTAALALLDHAMWLRAYHQRMSGSAVRWVSGKPVRKPYPYQSARPETYLARLVREYPADPVRDQAQLTLATLVAEKDPREGEAALRELIAERPDSKWAEDARAYLQQMVRPDLRLRVGQTVPGRPTSAVLTARNIDRADLALYRVDLGKAIAAMAARAERNQDLTSHTHLFGSGATARDTYGARVASWSRVLGDPADRKPRTHRFAPPARQVGAYVLEAVGEHTRAATLLLVTDLVLVQLLERNEAVYFLADADTGKPVDGATVTVRQQWQEGNTTRVAFDTARTDPTGVAAVKLRHNAAQSNSQVQAMAQLGDRYAMIGASWHWRNWGKDSPWRVHSLTDRAVYRPGQTVSFRELLFRSVDGAWMPAAAQAAEVQVRDPKGSVVHEARLKTSEFGSANGDFTLGSEVPLGAYAISVSVPGAQDRDQHIGSGAFRVEEYKKPEFEVTVSPSADRVRVGETASATIRAAYYFGGPAPGAHVEYRVYRSPWAQSYVFPRPYPYLYGHERPGDYNTYYRNGEVVNQGTARTDEKGEARISFPAAPAGSSGGASDYTFTIEADVQDASRRVISGVGSVKATRHDVGVFLNFPHGYATRGDRVDVEVVTLDPSDQPVSVAGTARVYRIADDAGNPKQKVKETEVWQQPLSTDKQGRAYIRWTAEKAGRYRIEFETRDRTAPPAPAPGVPDPHRVAGSLHLWVSGPELAAGRFLLQDVVFTLQDPYVREGQSAKALIVTPAPNCTVVLLREAEGQLLERRVLTVPGRSLEVTLPVTRRDAPNAYFTALLIRGGRVFQSTAELFVPPLHGIAKVTVEADRAQYEPGQKAQLKLTARDWEGRPVRAELSVSVSDAALAYIQKDFTPDIRTVLYGNRRDTGVSAVHSGGVWFAPTEQNTSPVQTFRTHEWVLPEGMGMLPDWPGQLSEHWYQWRSYTDFGYMALGRPGRSGMGGGGFGGYLNERMDMADMAGGVPASAAPGEPAAMKGRAPFGGAAPGDAEGGADARTNFVDTAFWTPSVVTGEDGGATVEVTWPDNLTQWRATTTGVTASAQVGVAETTVTTRKDLLVRLQTPRFMVERDVITLTANVHNYTSAPAEARVSLALGGDVAELQPGSAAVQSVNVPVNGERRVDWQVRVLRHGALSVRASAQAAGTADAMELRFPVIVHGVERQTAVAGVLREADTARVPITLPEARKPGSSELVVQVSPSLGMVMLDALPYLVDYPYGCIEQTMSRFIPCVVVARTLRDAGYDLDDLGRRARERAADPRPGQARAVDGSPYTYPAGTPGELQERALASGLAWWHRRASAPVFKRTELDAMVAEGLARIQRWQHPDGGWGWWSTDTTDPYMTAYVVYGLLTAREAGYDIDANVLRNGQASLQKSLLEDDNLHRMAYLARVLAMDGAPRPPVAQLVAGRMYENRERLSPYSKAHLAMALQDVGRADLARTVLRNMETTLLVDEANGTASWPEARAAWWCWWNNNVETNAVALQAYMHVEPDARVAPMVMRWLVNNRRGNVWRSTRETAESVYALAAFAKATGELKAEYTLTLDLDGRVKRTYNVTRENALFLDGTFVVPDALLRTGEQTLTVKREGAGAVYWSAYTRTFSLEEPLKLTGNEVFVNRTYYRLLPGTASGTPETTRLDKDRPNPFLTRRYDLLDAGGVVAGWRDPDQGPRYQRVALRDGDTVVSGDLLEVELRLDAKNDYDYVVLEDLKPAGCEPVEVRSGSHGGSGVWSNMELRDQKVAFFVSHLPQGKRALSYRLRAETPGAFHVLPTNAYAMYAPDVRALSDEARLEVRDRPQ